MAQIDRELAAAKEAGVTVEQVQAITALTDMHQTFLTDLRNAA